jgi:hypothetical protein
MRGFFLSRLLRGYNIFPSESAISLLEQTPGLSETLLGDVPPDRAIWSNFFGAK